MMKEFEMEAGQIADEGCDGLAYAPPAQEEHFDSPKFDPLSNKAKKVKGNNQISQEKDTTPSVSNCYIFKSQLQEYCQRAGLSSPVYDTIKEGPSHEPYFKASVVVNNVRYDSLPAFFNRKTAEQSAAEVALIELAKSNTVDFGISQSVHETGLCKNLLQEYAQKMNYAIPLYTCSKSEKEGRVTMYSCVVEIGGIKYIGASASTKKEAEIKAARTAWLAIQTAVPLSEDQTSNSIYTVIPQKRKASELAIASKETNASLKTNKGQIKKPNRRKRRPLKRDKSAGEMACLEVKTDGQVGVESTVLEAVKFEPDSTVDVNIVGNGSTKVEAADISNSRSKTNGGSSIHEDSQKQEVCVASAASTNGDSGNSGTITCSTTCDGNPENAGVPFGACCKDLGSTVMDVK